MPVSVSDSGDDWDQDREGEVLVRLEDGEEVVVLEEAHRSISHLEMRTRDALDKSLEELGDDGFEFSNIANFQNFEELSQEHDFFG